MSAFVAGIIFGGLLTGAIVTLLITRTRSAKRVEPIEWQEDYFEDPPPPPVTFTTKVLVNKRTVQI
jgi:hypothetical protein